MNKYNYIQACMLFTYMKRVYLIKICFSLCARTRIECGLWSAECGMCVNEINLIDNRFVSYVLFESFFSPSSAAIINFLSSFFPSSPSSLLLEVCFQCNSIISASV